MKRATGRSWLAACLCASAAHAQAELRVIDAEGATLEAAQAQASLSRTLPPELGGVPGPDQDALRFLLIGTPDSGLQNLEVLTLNAAGRPLDARVNFPSEAVTCPDGVAPELVCRQSLAVRLVAVELDRAHPAAQRRTLLAVPGGKLRVSLGGQRLLELPVVGWRSRGAAPELLRPRLRVLVLRGRRGGAPAVGGTDAGAKSVMQRELDAASGLWAQCGVELGGAAIDVVDPPSAELLTVGCGVEQAASGGWLRLRSGARQVALETRAGESPRGVALRLAEALARAGKAPPVFENQRTAAGALPTADLLLEGPEKWQPSEGQPLSSDPTLPLCLGAVDLNDGLEHFRDGDAFSGTFEERALLRAFDDGDPRSIELFVVPRFDSVERIGESFIVSPGSSLSSSVIVDRSAIAAGARSFALAHELGHVLLAMPGHPDDFGVDQSWSLMDADVADPTVFGPRRLSSADCERVLTESGPRALTPLLRPAPLAPRATGAR